MAISEEGGGIPATMLVGPTGYGGGNNSFGFGGDWAWILLLLVLFGNNGWGNGFSGGGAGEMFPWMNNANQINNGFRDQMLGTQINGVQNAITTGFGDVQNALCGGFAGVTASVVAAQNGIAQQLYGNEIANLQASNALQAQLAQCLTKLLNLAKWIFSVIKNNTVGTCTA